MTDSEELVNSRIENLRPKLLDLSRRNPLLSTRCSDRSHSHVRVVDELPDVIFEFLSEARMRFRPLPKLEEDPKDEQTPKFEVVACIAGRGFGVRRKDMKKLLLATRGKVFTLQNMTKLVECTRAKEFKTRPN